VNTPLGDTATKLPVTWASPLFGLQGREAGLRDGITTGDPAMKTTGSAVWERGIKDGRGAISTHSGALKAYPYGFASRFEGKPGTNPEELIGAAHAGCFTMALSLILGEAPCT
jgi:hypothetical protein